jgi:hypothetical protein
VLNVRLELSPCGLPDFRHGFAAHGKIFFVSRLPSLVLPTFMPQALFPWLIPPRNGFSVSKLLAKGWVAHVS